MRERKPLTMAELEERIGGLSNPDKMPCHSWSTPAKYCKTGSKLRRVDGSVCEGCYCFERGCYQYPVVLAAMERRWALLQRILAEPATADIWTHNFAELLERKRVNTLKRIGRGHAIKNDGRVFRWHDSGDLQSAYHLSLLANIAQLAPKVNFWLPTREKGFVKEFLRIRDIPSNMVIRLSLPMRDTRPSALQMMWSDSVPGLQWSGVHTEGDHGDETCIAYTQDGECLNCRACWDDEQHYVSYPLH